MPGTGLSKIVVDCGSGCWGVDEPADPSPAFPLEVAVCEAVCCGQFEIRSQILVTSEVLEA